MNGEDRRREIETAAARLFAENGFRGATVKEIANLAGVSEASLYQYFHTKADLYAAVLENAARNFYCGEWLDELREYAARDNDENLFRHVAAKISGGCRQNADFLRLLLYSALEGHAGAKQFCEFRANSVFEFLCEYIERRQREKAFQPCDAGAVAGNFIGAQVRRAVVGMLPGNLFAQTGEKAEITDYAQLTLDELRDGAVSRREYTGIF